MVVDAGFREYFSGYKYVSNVYAMKRFEKMLNLIDVLPDAFSVDRKTFMDHLPQARKIFEKMTVCVAYLLMEDFFNRSIIDNSAFQEMVRFIHKQYVFIV